MKLSNVYAFLVRKFSLTPQGQQALSQVNITSSQVVALFTFVVLVFFAFFAPIVIEYPSTSGHIDPNTIKEPFQTYKYIIGTDLFSRDLIDVFLYGLYYTFMPCILITLFHVIVTIPLAVVTSYNDRTQAFYYTWFQQFTVLPAVFLFVIFMCFWSDANTGSLIAVILSTFFFVFYNSYRDVVQIKSVQMIKTLQNDGCKFGYILRIVIIPVLTPNFLRLLRRTLILAVTEFILIDVTQINVNPVSMQWGTVIYNAWKYRALNEYTLIIMVFLVSITLLVSTVAFVLLERYFRLINAYRAYNAYALVHEQQALASSQAKEKNKSEKASNVINENSKDKLYNSQALKSQSSSQERGYTITKNSQDPRVQKVVTKVVNKKVKPTTTSVPTSKVKGTNEQVSANTNTKRVISDHDYYNSGFYNSPLRYMDKEDSEYTQELNIRAQQAIEKVRQQASTTTD